MSQIPLTPKPYLPPHLGNSAETLAVRYNTVGFFQVCVEARRPHELNQLPPNPHPATTLITHMRIHVVPIKAEQGMTKQDLTTAIRYGARSSATKETAFFRTDMAEQARAGHISLFPLRAVRHLPQPCLSLLAAIPKRGRKSCLVYDFSWSGINEEVTKVSYKKAVRFNKSLYRVVDCILAAPPKLGPTFLNKVNLADAYTHIWVHLKDIPLVAFLVPKYTLEKDQLVMFHFSISMGYVESAAFFYATTKTVKDRTLETLSTRHTAPLYHLEDLADTKPPQTSAEEVAAMLESDIN